MRLASEPYRPATPGAAWRAGVAYLPGDRTGEGLILDFDVLSNVTLAARPRRGPFFDRRRAWALTAEAIRDLGIKAGGRTRPAPP